MWLALLGVLSDQPWNLNHPKKKLVFNPSLMWNSVNLFLDDMH